MPVEQSILKSTKKILGGAENDPSFDLDVITHINTCFFRLRTLGIGPPEGFMVEDDSVVWADFNTADLDLTVLNSVKTYIYLKSRAYFDPPGTPHHLTALNEQINELEHVMLTESNLVNWKKTSLPGLGSGDVVVQGGDLDG